MSPEIVEIAGELSEADDAQLKGDEVKPFGDTDRYRWRDKERFYAVRDEDGVLTAAAGLVVASVSVDGGAPFVVAGVGGVIVRADRRGEGLARRVVEAVLDAGERLGPRFALLFCLPDRAGLYARLGFTAIEAPVTVAQPDGPTAMEMWTMWRPLRAAARWPDGPVVLDELPF